MEDLVTFAILEFTDNGDIIVFTIVRNCVTMVLHVNQRLL